MQVHVKIVNEMDPWLTYALWILNKDFHYEDSYFLLSDLFVLNQLQFYKVVFEIYIYTMYMCTTTWIIIYSYVCLDIKFW